MIEKKTTLEINELLGMLQTLNELEYQEKREWASVESLLKKLSESVRIQNECEDYEEAWKKLAVFLVDLTEELKGRGE